MTILNHALGALYGLAVGDALGMPTQYLPRETVAARWGILKDFHPGPDDNDISKGQPAGKVTDDTDQAVILGHLLIEGDGLVDAEEFARRLLDWQTRMIGMGSADLLGPSTVRALNQVKAGVSVEETGRWGDTNGAAMRITPVGIAFPVPGVVDAVEQVSKVTHNTGIALAGAAAIAAAVSSGLDGNTLTQSLDIAINAAQEAGQRGNYVAGPDVAARISWALELVAGGDPDDALALIYRLVGVGVATQEAIPAALAIATLFPDDVWDACRYSASLGGDCDTIAAMAGAVVGAHTGMAFPDHALQKLRAANPVLGLEQLSKGLLALRAENEAR